jgi:hypothetical protein
MPAELNPMVQVCKPKVNNSDDGMELMKCTNWWKTEIVFFAVFFWVTAPLWYTFVPTFRGNLLSPSSGLSNLVLVGNIV